VRLLKNDLAEPWFGDKQEAEFLATVRNRYYGRNGLRYTVIPKASSNFQSNNVPPEPQKQ
jgi:hypothetical protein